MTASRWSSGVSEPRAPSIPSAPACASMSETPTAVFGVQPEFSGRARIEGTDAFTGTADVGADAHETVGREIVEADLGEVRLVPAPLVAEIRPLADRGAERTVVASGGPPRQVVGEVEPMRRALPRLGRCSFTQRSFGVSISGEIEPPTNWSTGWWVASIASASATARWSIHTMTLRRSSPSRATVTGAQLASSATSEHVASNPMPTTFAASMSETASRAAVQTRAPDVVGRLLDVIRLGMPGLERFLARVRRAFRRS